MLHDNHVELRAHELDHGTVLLVILDRAVPCSQAEWKGYGGDQLLQVEERDDGGSEAKRLQGVTSDTCQARQLMSDGARALPAIPPEEGVREALR